MGRKVKGKGKTMQKSQIKAKSSIHQEYMFKHLQNTAKFGLTDTETRSIMKEVKKINRSGATMSDVNKGMNKINGLLKGSGVEEIHIGSKNLSYVNMGDTYDTTIVYDFESGEASVGAIGTHLWGRGLLWV